MKLFLVSAVLAFVGLASCQPTARSVGIIDGQDADIKDYPYQVSVIYINKHICGGAIISPNHVVTAAQCVTRGRLPELLSVYVGSSNRTGGGEEYYVKSVRVHKKYNAKYYTNDIAILTLRKSLTFGPTVQPVKLPEEGKQYKGGDLAVVTGWGVVNKKDKEYPQILQKTALPIVDREVCKQDYLVISFSTYVFVTEDMVCAGYEKGGNNVCVGDSGAPLVIDGTLVGLSSWGEGCALPKLPAVYANVAYLRSFIKEVTGL